MFRSWYAASWIDALGIGGGRNFHGRDISRPIPQQQTTPPEDQTAPDGLSGGSLLDLFADHDGHHLVGDVEVCVDLLNVVVLLQGVEVYGVLGLHGDLRVLELGARRAQRVAHLREVLGRRHDPVVALHLLDVLGAGLERQLHELVFVHRTFGDQDDALALEEVGYGAARPQLAAVLGEDVPDVRRRPIPVVREDLDEHGYSAGGVALVGDPLERLGVGACAGALVYGALDVVVRHVGFFGLRNREPERRVHLRVSPALAGRDRYRPTEFAEERPPLGVGRAFLALDR